VAGQRAPRVTGLSDEFYTTAQIARFRRWWDLEPDNAMALTAPTPPELSAARAWVPAALAHLHECAPDLHDEVLAIVDEIVIARPDGSQRLDYGGASSFALWGAITVNAAKHDDWPRYYRTIMHETAHLLLFAIAREQPLVAEPHARGHSPLRDGLRPLDGIFHAAFVSARESLAIDRLLCRHEEVGSVLDARELATLEDLLEGSATAFWECVETLRNEDSLTPLGEAVLGECETYMKANFAVLDPVVSTAQP
jgi:HEXXH motif-containing protein